MDEDQRIDGETIAEITQDVEDRAKQKLPVVKIKPGLVVGALELLQMEKEEPGLLPEQLREDLYRDVAHKVAAREGMFPVLIDGEEQFAPLSDLEASYPENFKALEAHIAWNSFEIERLQAENAHAQFAVDVFKSLEHLDVRNDGDL